MTRGHVKWWGDRSGTGFLRPDGGGEDVYVHFAVVEPDRPGRKTLHDGQAVEFDAERTAKGMRATLVRVVPEDSAATQLKRLDRDRR